MISHAPATTAAAERPVVIDGPAGALVGVVAEPSDPNGYAVVQLGSAGWRASSGNRRAHVHLARRAAAAGFHALRVSYQGIAESTGTPVDVVRLDQPFVDEAAAVAAWTHEAGLRPIVLGNCFGGRTSLAYAASAPPGAVAGVVALVPPVHDFEVARRLEERPPSALARRVTPRRAVEILRDPARRRALGRTLRGLTGAGRRALTPGHPADPPWLSRAFCRQLAEVTGRGVPVLVLYGDDDGYGADFTRSLAGTLGGVVRAAGPTLTVVTVPGRVHGLASVATQTAMLDAVSSWLAATFASEDLR